MSMYIFWIVFLVLMVVVEVGTAQLTTVWFAVGCLFALIAEGFGAPIWLQWTLFVAGSLLLLIATRPLVRKLLRAKPLPTNADRYIGETAVVTEDIDNIAGKGTVKIKGILWTARSEDDAVTFSQGDRVTVIRIEGVKVIVSPQ